MSEEIKEILRNCEKAINDASGYNDTTNKILDYITNLQQKVEQLENIRKEAKDFIKNKIEYYNGKRLEDTKYEYIHIDVIDDLLNILNKGSEE